MATDFAEIDVSRAKTTLAWVEGELAHARREGRERLMELLEAVRVEIVFDVMLAENPGGL